MTALEKYIKYLKQDEKDKYITKLYYRITPILFGFFLVCWWIIKLSPEDVPTDFIPIDGMKGITIEFMVEFIILFVIFRFILKRRAKKRLQKKLNKFKQFQRFMEGFEPNYFPILSQETILRNKDLLLHTSSQRPKEYKAPPTEQIRFLERKLSEFERKYSVEPFTYSRYGKEEILDIYGKLHNKLRNRYPYYVNAVIQELLTKYQVQWNWLDYRTSLKSEFENTKQQALQSYQKHLGILESGNRGEDRVEKELHQLSSLGSYLSNVRIKIDGSSVETDNIIFTPNGIFLIEVKNFSESGSYSLRITKDGQWQRVYKNGIIKPMENDVTVQHNRHLILKEKFIQRKWKEKYREEAPKITYRPIIVIANDKIMIKNETDLPILRISQIYHHILKHNDNLPDDTLNKVKNILEENQLPLKIYGVPDWTEALLKQERAIEILNSFHEEMYLFLTHLDEGLSRLNFNYYD